MKRLLKTALVAAVLAAGSAPALAANVSLTGDLSGGDGVQLFSFTLAGASNVMLRTWSYAGGINAAGDAVSAGGFDTIVSLFSGSGNSAILIDANDDGLGVATDPGTGLALDSLLDPPLALLAGIYTVALTQSSNFANGPTLADGFLGGASATFNGRTSHWALDLLGVDSANQIPLPSTLALALLGLAALGGIAGARSRRR